MKTICLYIVWFAWIAVLGAEQLDIPRIERMPNRPEPYHMRNWRQVARGYDSTAFNFRARGTHLPLIWRHTATVNYPEHDSFGLVSAVGVHNPAAEAVNVLPAVIGASLVGIDKSDQNGENRVLMCEEFFNKRPSENVYLNNFTTTSGNDWWYDTMPNIFFYQLYDLYPETGHFPEQFIIVANRWLAAVRAMGGSTAPWQAPYMNYRAWSLSTMTPLASGVTQPEAAGALGWLLYHAFVETGAPHYRIGAEWCLEFLDAWTSNPSYELQLPYGVYAAARMNAELGADYNVEKMVNWCFDVSGNVRNWGATLGNWGGYDCDGLIGEAKYAGYAFAMNGFEQAGALVPMVRYDDRFSRAIGKWMLNAANASRLFYHPYLPETRQSNSNWSRQFDPNAVISYEALREFALHTGISPYAGGDFMRHNWGATNLALYGASHVGIFGGIIDTTNVPMILKLDTRKTDYFQDEAFPTFLYFNPYDEEKTVRIEIGWTVVDLYDAVSNTFVADNVSGIAEFDIPGDTAMLLVLTPADGEISYEYEKMLVNTIVADYSSGQPVNNFPPRIKSLAAADTHLAAGTTTTLYCTAVDRDAEPLNFTWILPDSTVSGEPAFTWTAPDSVGDYTLRCKVHDGSALDSASVQIQVVEFINHAPEIQQLRAEPSPLGINENCRLAAQAIDPDADSLTFTWTANAGRITGSDSCITWTAPAEQGYFFITCRIEDGRGGVAADSVGVIVLNPTDIQTGVPVAYYPLDGHANDLSGFDLHGTAFGPTTVADPVGNVAALDFDGIDDFILVRNDPLLNFTKQISVGFWIKIKEFISGESYPISHGNWENRWKVSISPNSQTLRWTIKTRDGVADLDSKTALLQNEFYHVLTLFDGSEMKIYLNGKLDNTRSWSGALLKTDIDLTIGRVLPNNTSHNFHGVLDDIRIYSYAVSSKELANIFNLLSAVKSANSGLPRHHALGPNYPNPFNASTTIPYQLKVSGRVEIEIYNILGETVKSWPGTEKTAGYHQLLWDGKNDSGQVLASGIYVCALKINDFFASRKLVILR